MKTSLKLALSILVILLAVTNCDEKKDNETNPADSNPTSDNPFAGAKVVATVDGFNGAEAIAIAPNTTFNGTLYVGDAANLSIYHVLDTGVPILQKKISLTTVNDLFVNHSDPHLLFTACGGHGLYIYDISAGVYNFNPQSKAFIPGGFYKDITVYQNHLYIASQLSRGVRMYNVASPESPFLQTSIDEAANSNAVTISGNGELVVADYNGKIKFFDISNPNSVTSTTQPKVSLLAGGYLKAAAGNYGRVCISSENGIYIISPIGNAQQNPEIQASMAIPSYIEDVEILYKSSPQEKYYAFLAAGNRDFMIVDITDVKNPKILKEFALDGTAYAITLMSGYAYVAADTHVHIIKYE
jgi:hypothetical protein